MNYLAHFHLSDGDDELIIGALLGDFVKGPLKSERSIGLEHGIMLHRKVDAFTDSHPGLKECHSYFSAEFKRFAGIMTDVMFDHFLSLHWQHFHTEPLSTFSKRVFQLLDAATVLTPEARNQADRLSQHNVFMLYQEWQTVEAALLRIGQRFRRKNPLHLASSQLLTHYDKLEQFFLQFYPELQQYVLSQRELMKHT